MEKKIFKNENHAVGYCRYSSDNQREESIDAQKRAIQKYADENNILICNWYCDEGFSGTNSKRPRFREMINDSKNGTFSLVLVHKLDRFARNKFDSATAKRELKINGVRVFSVIERIEDNPEGKILESLLESMAEFYSENLARETLKGMLENAHKCMCCGGKPPYGYKRVPRIVNGEIVYNKKGNELHDTAIDPTNAEAVKIIFNMTLEGKTRHEIIERLNNLGFKNDKGKPFKNPTSIDAILRNERYTGVYIFNQYRKKLTLNGVSKELNDEKEIIKKENGFPPIIPTQTFQLVQKILKNRIHRSPHITTYEYLLSGKIFCGECGQTYSGYTKNKNGEFYHYYRCLGNSKSVYSTKLDGKPCGNTSIRQDSIETFVINKIYSILSDENLAENLHTSFNDYIRKHKYDYSTLELLDNKITDVSNKINNIVTAISNGKNFQSLSDELSRLEIEKEELEKLKQSELQSQKEYCLDLESLRKAIVKTKKLLKSDSFKEKKALIDSLLNKVVVYNDHVDIYINAIPTIISGNFDLEVDFKELNRYKTKTLTFPEDKSLKTKESHQELVPNEIQYGSPSRT